jgi:ankyrin repeat protein
MKLQNLSQFPGSKSLSPEEDNPRDSDLERLIAENEQQKLVIERQLTTLGEKKRQLEDEKQRKQKETESLKQQQHQSKLKHNPKAAEFQQSFLIDQLELQNQLVEACKQADKEKVTSLLILGAKPDIPNKKGEQPLGAAVWGMCPDVVNILLEQLKDWGAALMTWKQCEDHNNKHYEKVFIFSEDTFISSYPNWYMFLESIERRSFIRDYHLREAKKHLSRYECTHPNVPAATANWSWEDLKQYILLSLPGSNVSYYQASISKPPEIFINRKGKISMVLPVRTGCKKLRKQIKQMIEKAFIDLSRDNKDVEHTMLPLLRQERNTWQLELQNKLIAACKQGDEKTVTVLLQKGAKSDMPNTKGELPLGAAVWGMCPGVVNVLLKQTGRGEPMTWQECEAHNLKYYREMFIIPQFLPTTYKDWHNLLLKMDCNPFIRNTHFDIYCCQHKGNSNLLNWQGLKKYVMKNFEIHMQRSKLVSHPRVNQCNDPASYTGPYVYDTSTEYYWEYVPRMTNIGDKGTENKYAIYRTQVKQQIETATRSIQDQLIVACKQGDEKRVRVLLGQGAKPDVTNARGEHPFGAAVWGMCPDVVNVLFEKVEGVAPMTWGECKHHNLKFYKEVFIVSELNVWAFTYGEWFDLLLKIDSNLFVRDIHLKAYNKERIGNWENLINYVGGMERSQKVVTQHLIGITNTKYRGLKQEIEHQPVFETLELVSVLTSQNRQTLMPVPNRQLELQNQLIAACKKGDEKMVITLLAQGAKPNMTNTQGEQPLGAAVWGMCPGVVNALLKKSGDVALMTWEKCKEHNLNCYKTVFIVPEFKPDDSDQWYTLLKVMEPNLFVRNYHLKKVHELWQNGNSSSWENLKLYVVGDRWGHDQALVYSDFPLRRQKTVGDTLFAMATEMGYVRYRNEIEQMITEALHPKVQMSFSH